MAGSESIPSNGPTGTVTFLFTDIEASTDLVRRLKGGYGDVLELHNRLLRATFAAHRGHEVDTQGDAFLVAFARARDAVEVAVEAQRALACADWAYGALVRVRMGVHTTEPGVRPDGYHGLGVVRGARICASGHGGQVLLSAATRALIDDEELDGVTVLDLGMHRLKGLLQPERIYQLAVEGLPSSFPPLQTTVAEQGVEGRAGELAAAAEAAVTGGERQYGILGPLEVRRDGELVSIGGQKQRALLATLLVRANEVVSIDRLVDDLWGDEPPRTAVTSLQNFVVTLRKALGPDAVLTRPPGYVLQVSPDALDAARFESLLRNARSASVSERAGLLTEALALWRGEPLAEFAYASFAQTEMRRLEDLRLVALEERIEVEIQGGRHSDVIGEIEALIASNPLRERLRAQLMLALYRADRQAEALQVYQDARQALAEDLGIEPGPALRQLHGSILRHEAGLEATTARNGGTRTAAPDHLGEVVDAIFAGRVVPVLGSAAAGHATTLAERFRYPLGEALELPRVSQYAAVTRGYGPLYDELHALVEAQGEPTAAHRFFAALPAALRERGAPHQLLVTTAYDRALERAFAEAGEEVDVVSYLASGRNRGKFCHLAPDGEARVIDVPNTYAVELSLARRTVILKVRGQVDATPTRDWESFVVTEDDHIDYLGRADVAAGVPIGLAATLRRSHFLFLGYTMRDWCLRLVLGRIWGDAPAPWRAWAVHPEPGPAERELWRRVDVDLVESALEPYIAALAATAGLPAAEVSA